MATISLILMMLLTTVTHAAVYHVRPSFALEGRKRVLYRPIILNLLMLTITEK